MGIQGLTLRLVNRGQWITLSQQPETQSGDSQSENAQEEPPTEHQQRAMATIIDGPSLAYHICGGYREDHIANGEAELKPSYSDIGVRTIQFLEDSEAVGLQM